LRWHETVLPLVSLTYGPRARVRKPLEQKIWPARISAPAINS
jgi:hypothetical protein